MEGTKEQPKSAPKVIEIHLRGEAATRNVYANGKKLILSKSLKLVNHSPDGFNWGYSGSGPAQLALAVLLEVFVKEKAIANYQRFKFDVISRIPGNKDFDLKVKIPY